MAGQAVCAYEGNSAECTVNAAVLDCDWDDLGLPEDWGGGKTVLPVVEAVGSGR
jgi:hypothetical protein